MARRKSTSDHTPRRFPVDSEFLKKARERFKAADEADQKQAERENHDIRFEAGEQWTDEAKSARAAIAASGSMPAIPARPTLVINKIKEPVRNTLNQERASDLGIELVPADDFGDLGITPDETEIKLREGLVRRIQRESEAQDARTWAFKRAVIAGRGYYMVLTRFLPGKSWDQEIYVERIFDQSSVKLDPSHVKPDGSDAEWAFVGTWMAWDRFQAEYPYLADGKDNPAKDFSKEDFVSMVEQYPDWYQMGEGDQKFVRISDHYYTEHKAKKAALLEDGTVMWAEEVPEGVEPVDTRTVIEKQIKFCKIGGGILELEKTDLASPFMPIIKVVGDEVLPFDGERRCEGMVRPAIGAQVGENYMISRFVETVGLAPLPAPEVDPEAIEGYEDWWKNAATRAVPYRPRRSYDDAGRPFGQTNYMQPDSNIQPMAQGIQMFDHFIKSTTSVPDSTLGNVDPALKSGRAIREVVANAQMSTSNFLDNLARSIRYEGQVINSLLYPIYGAKPGRLVRILTGEGEREVMRIIDPEQQADAQQEKAKAEKVGKLTKDANFNVIVKIGKSYDSRRSQEASQIGELISANPELMTWFGDVFLTATNGPGSKQMAERAKVMLAPPIQQMLATQEQGKEPLPPEVQAQIQAMQQENEQLKAALGEASKIAEGKQAEAQAKLQAEDMAARAALAKAEMEQAAKVEQEQIRAQMEAERSETELIKAVLIEKMRGATAIATAQIAATAKVLDTEVDGEIQTALHEQDAANQAIIADMQQSQASAEDAAL